MTHRWLLTKDIEKAKAFYIALFDWEAHMRSP